MSRDTADFINNTIANPKHAELGYGEALGKVLIDNNAPQANLSLLATAYKAGIPLTAHVALGADIIHQHLSCDGAATGRASMKDFRIFLTEKMFYNKVIEDKFKLGVVIEFSEIEDFYNKDYLPSRRNLGMEPKSIIEMTPVIESHLRGKKVQKELSQWLEGIKASYSIKNIISDEREQDEKKAG